MSDPGNSETHAHHLLIDAIADLAPENKDILDYLSADFTPMIWGSGDHLLKNERRSRLVDWVIAELRNHLRNIRDDLRVMASSKTDTSGDFVVYQDYFNIADVIADLRSIGLRAKPAPWCIGSDNARIRYHANKMQEQLTSGPLSAVIGNDFCAIVRALEVEIDQYFAMHSCKGLILPYDMYGIQRIAIRSARRNSIPSLIFQHGLPGIYSALDNLRADYLAVWGDAIRQIYVSMGADPSRVIVTGHPSLSGGMASVNQRLSFENVLVLTKSLPGGNPISERTVVRNREGCMAYPFLVERALRNIGVERARLRPHPSESRNWYRGVVGSEFYELDDSPLDQSLEQATVVVGPATTVWLQARAAGVHFQVFEPLMELGTDVLGDVPVPPFDGSDERLNVAQNVDQLTEALSDRIQTESSIYSDWMADRYDSSSILEILKT